MTEAASKHANIHEALAAAQSEMKPPVKNATNPAFKRDGNPAKYADLDSVTESVRAPLTNNGISWRYSTRVIDGEWVLVAHLDHGESGTGIECPVPLLVGKRDMHGFKSATTYAKRIGLESVTGQAPADDDDGNAAAQTPPSSHTSSTGLRDAWVDGVLDKLPENATDRQRAVAFSEAIIEEMQSKKSPSGVNGVWNKREAVIGKLDKKHNDLFQSVFECFETCMASFEEAA